MRRQTPCKECRYRRKRCVWVKSSDKVCERCSKAGIECHPLKDKSELIPLTTQGDADELQYWETIISLLGSEMEELEIVKSDLEQSLIRKKHLSFEWDLTLANGTLILETPIRTMEELVLFSQASLRYLSPFTGLFNKQPIRFESMSMSITIGVSSLIQRHEMLNSRRKRFAILEYDPGNSSARPSTTADHRAVVDLLIPMYMEQHNSITGLLHESTFCKYYHSLDDPLDDALTLAVSIDALMVLRNFTCYTPSEKCILAEIFYERCKDKLFDMYDDPTKKLQVIVITSLLPLYVADVLLKCLEANRMVNVALLACADLAKDFDKMTPVEAITFQRNYFHLETNNRMHKMLYEDKVDFTVVPTGRFEFQVLDDESEKTKRYMHLYNHIFRLIGSHYVSSIVGKFNSMFYGLPCEMPLEDILHYQPLIKDWWGSLPPELKLCDDPFSPIGLKLIQQSLSSDHLIPFTVVHLLTSMFMASILQPQVMPESDDTATEEAIHVIRANSVSLVLHSCRILVYALMYNWDPYSSDLPNLSFAIIMYGVYALERLANCDDIEVPVELLALLKSTLETKFSAVLPDGHLVPSSISPLASYLKNSSISPYEFYEKYPFPGYALLSDVLSISIRDVEQKISARR